MNFNQEMEKFFKGYSLKERQEVESWPTYQEAAKNENLALAQEFAVMILEGCGQTKREAKDENLSKRIKRFIAKSEKGKISN